MLTESTAQLLLKIKALESRLAESEQLIEAIKAGEVDAFAISSNNQSEIYTLQSGDYAYRVLVEEFGEGAVNVTEEGLVVYTNAYFHELIHLPYEKVVGTSFYDFIHTDSKKKFDELFAQALKGRSKGEINLEVNNRIIPVYTSFTSLQPKLPTVGIIISDLTEKKKHEEVILKYQNELEAKNRELVQTNEELASFTYIASHDLQEPLRKIQTFSNLILDKEYQNLSLKTKDYFQRIVASSTQMQNLIAALLNYSRASATECFYMATDLNTIVEEVKNTLYELIERNNVVIEASMLPTLKVVPIQFNQLFSNIIANAIKYRRPEVNPLIKIHANLVSADEIQVSAAFKDDKYWEISVTDNGIGFEQQYAEKIFELFQRLYTRNEYEGTGIGLAICKKIIQNHGGFIKAVGQPGIGSTFSIYLPLNH